MCRSMAHQFCVISTVTSAGSLLMPRQANKEASQIAITLFGLERKLNFVGSSLSTIFVTEVATELKVSVGMYSGCDYPYKSCLCTF